MSTVLHAAPAALRLPTQTLHVTLEPDMQVLMRLLELAALRGHLPASVAFRHHGPTGGLELQLQLEADDFRVLCARAATLVGVLEVAATPGPAPLDASPAG